MKDTYNIQLPISNWKDIVTDDDCSFEITNVKFVFSLLSVSDNFLSKYDSTSNNSELVLPITTFQRHISTFPSSEVEPVIFINSAKKEVRRAYSVFTKPLNTVQDAPLAGTPASGSGETAIPAVDVGTAIQQPHFLKGTSDGNQACIRFSHRYQDRQFPENYVQATVDKTGSVTNQTHLLAHVLTNIPPEKTKMSPYLATLSSIGGTNIRSIYEEQFMIVQDFRFSDDKGVINTLNMNFNSSPLILELKMSMADSSGIATNVNSYLELSSEVVISADGGMSIVTKAAQ
jgi:hypothetical protein